MGKNDVIDDSIASFAMAYADQTVVDHAALVKAKGKATAKGAAKSLKLVEARKTAKAA